ncbi:MAG: 2-C-methyl-D-erythritol 2,4-cyclodiphosphate synthase [Candidatus Zixiibacteriota bacterium]
MRVGHGYDFHRLVEGRKLIIGGVEIKYDRGLLGHSDADVLLHAVADALLGAVGLPDIGQHFPPDDEKYRNADSSELLKTTLALVKEAGMKTVVNIDCVIVAEAPKMKAHIPAMREKIAAVLNIGRDRVGIKATTTEGCGCTGRGEGIAASAICLVEKND